jgi:ATP-dependent Clp protease ATP-binding subunit ClpC
MGKLPQTPRAKKVIEYAMEDARNLNQNYISTGHLLLGLMRVQDGVAAKVLADFGLTIHGILEQVIQLFGLIGKRQLVGKAPYGTRLINS